MCFKLDKNNLLDVRDISMLYFKSPVSQVEMDSNQSEKLPLT